MKTKLLILFLVLLVPNGKFLIGQVEDCLTMVYPNDFPYEEYYNPDSIMVDTCRQSLTYEKLYAKRGYFFIQDMYIFGDRILKGDDVVTWEDISSTFTQIKEQFQALEERFGVYRITKSIHSSWKDSSFRLNPVWDLEFDSYYAVDTICNSLNSIDSTICGGLRIEPTILYSVFESTKNKIDFLIRTYPNPASDYIEIDIERSPQSASCSLTQNIEIYNSLGELVLTSKIHPMTGSQRMNTEHLSSGIYYATVKSCTEIITKKFVIMR